MLCSSENLTYISLQIQVPKFNSESVLHGVHPNHSAIDIELQDQINREFSVFQDLSSAPSDCDRPLGALMKSKSMLEGYSIWKVPFFALTCGTRLFGEADECEKRFFYLIDHKHCQIHLILWFLSTLWQQLSFFNSWIARMRKSEL